MEPRRSHCFELVVQKLYLHFTPLIILIRHFRCTPVVNRSWVVYDSVIFQKRIKIYDQLSIVHFFKQQVIEQSQRSWHRTIHQDDLATNSIHHFFWSVLRVFRTVDGLGDSISMAEDEVPSSLSSVWLWTGCFPFPFFEALFFREPEDDATAFDMRRIFWGEVSASSSSSRARFLVDLGDRVTSESSEFCSPHLVFDFFPSKQEVFNIGIEAHRYTNLWLELKVHYLLR